MTVPLGPFRLVVSISRRCREALVIARAQGATDAELAQLATAHRNEAELLRWQADQVMYGSRLV